jgi:geranylgeranyl diphosphate synthase type II
MFQITVPSLKKIFFEIQEQVDKAIIENLDLLGPKSSIRDACEYSLTSGGKRIRPAIVLLISKSLGLGVDVTYAALATEFFHTASLVVDDLPSMDDDDERRSKASTHKVFGEAVALLTSYALISAGYMSLAKNAELIRCMEGVQFQGKDRICLVLENVAYNTGLYGATGGQFLDLVPPDLSLSTLKEIIHKKTISLFEISFVSGWLFGGGKSKELPLVKQAAFHFGMAFQIADDLNDKEQDKKNNRTINTANILGEKNAKQMFHEERSRFINSINLLGLNTAELQALTEIMLPLHI